MMEIVKPKIEDLEGIRKILEQWTENEEVEKYLGRIKDEINGITKFGMNFWVIKSNDLIVGVGGLADPLPVVIPLAQSGNPGEIKILYLDNEIRGKGFGKQMVEFLEKEARGQGYTELFIRSAERYKDTAYGFYEKVGYKKVGLLDNNMVVFAKVL